MSNPDQEFLEYCRALTDQQLWRVLKDEYTMSRRILGRRYKYRAAKAAAKLRGWTVTSLVIRSAIRYNRHGATDDPIRVCNDHIGAGLCPARDLSTADRPL